MDIGEQRDQRRVTLDVTGSIAPGMTLGESENAPLGIIELEPARAKIGFGPTAGYRRCSIPSFAPEVRSRFCNCCRRAGRRGANRQGGRTLFNPEPSTGPTQRSRCIEP